MFETIALALLLVLQPVILLTLVLVAGGSYRRGVRDGAFRPAEPHVRDILEAMRPGPRVGQVPHPSEIAAAAHAAAASKDRPVDLDVMKAARTSPPRDAVEDLRAAVGADPAPAPSPVEPPMRAKLVQLKDARREAKRVETYHRQLRRIRGPEGLRMTEAELRIALGVSMAGDAVADGPEGNLYDLLRTRQRTYAPGHRPGEPGFGQPPSGA